MLDTTSANQEIFFPTCELTLINTRTGCWRADHKILIHDGETGVN